VAPPSLPAATAANPVPAAATPDAPATEPDAPPAPRHPFHEPFATWDKAAATRLADLSPAACRREVAKRQLAVVPRKGAAPGVALPLRLTGPLRGVTFVVPPAPSPFGILDCRMALALDELAQILASFDVVRVRIDNIHRPHARLPGRAKPSQHSFGLAVDVMSFELAGGRLLSVERDWHAAIGTTACGPEAVMDEPSEESILLRSLLCEVTRRGLFHHILTPSSNASHRDHFHFDIKRSERPRR
jgi:hypothetical protein